MSALLSCATSGEISGQLTLSTATEHVALAGVTMVASFTAADPDATASLYTAVIDWGDGTSSPGTVVGADGSFTVQGGHAYAEEGSYALRVTVISSQGATSLDGFVTVVENDVLAAQPPLTIEATQNSAFSGVVARFTDSDLLSTAGDFSAIIEWGDGTSSSGTLAGANGSFTVSGTHSYATAGKLPVHVTLRDDVGTATAVASGSALVVSPTTLDLIDPLYGAVADLLGPFFQGFFGVTNERIGLLTTIPATEGQALTLPNILGDVPLPPDIPDMLLTSIPVAAFIDGNPADTATDFIALINWGDGTTTQGAVTLVASQDFDPAPGFVPPLHAAVFMVTGTHTYADESANEPLSVGIIRTSDNLSGTLQRSATIDFGHPAVVAGVTVAEADVLVPVLLGPLTANPNVVDGVVARFTDANLASVASDFAASIDWGDGTGISGTITEVNGTVTVSGTHGYANAGKYSVLVRLIDDDGGASATLQREAFIGLPLSGEVTLASATEHMVLANTSIASFVAFDANAPASAFTATIDWGDGTSSLGTVVGADGSFTVQGGHTYAEEGSYALHTTIATAEAAVSLDGSVRVADHDVLTAAQPSLTIEATQGSAFGGVVARFTDNDLVSPASDFSASINWGDGTTTSGIVSGSNGSFTVSGTHNYGIAGKLPLHVTLSDDGAGTASAVAAGSALVVSPETLDLIDPLYGAVADLLGPFFQGFFGVTDAKIGLLTTIPASEGVALTLPNILGDVPLPPDIPDMLLTSIPVAAFIDGNPADTATDFIALINWGDGTTTQGAVTLVASQDFDPAPGFVPPLHAAVFMVTGTHTYADESASEPLSVGIIRTSDNLSGTLHRSATIDFGHPAVVAGVTVAEADVLAPVPLGPLTANFNVVDGVVARFTNTNLASTAGDFIATIDWGDGTTTTTGTIDDVSGVITVSGAHSYANSGRYALAVTLADDDGNASATAQRDTFIGLPLPGEVTLSTATEHVALAGTTVVASCAAADPNAPASAFTAMIDWGDGTSSPGTEVGADGAFTVDAGHSYADEGRYALRATITTSQGATSLDGFVTVTDNDVLTAQPGLTIEATQGSAFSGVVARFTDSDLVSPASDFSASIDWGDGTATSGIVSGSNGSFTVSGTHNYGIAGKLPLHVTLSDDGAGTASAVAAASALVVSPTTLDLIDPLYGAVADLLGPFFQGFFGVTNERIGLLTTIPATEGQALTLPNILGDVPLPPDIPDMLLTSIPVAAFIDGNPADTATDFIALINWGDGTTTQGAVTLVASQDFDPAPGFVPPLHAAVFMVTGTHTYADESANEPLSVGIIRTSDNLSGTLQRSATIDFGHPAVVAGVTVAEADVLVPVLLGPLTANPNVVDGVVARFTDANLASVASDFAASIDWGDGTGISGTITEVNGTVTVSGTHGYANAGKYSVLVRLIDDDGGASATLQREAFIGLPLSGEVTLASATEHMVLANTSIASFVAFDANAPASAFTATIDWGDGTSSLGTVVGADGSFTVQGGHTYAEEGSYALHTTIATAEAAVSLDGSVRVADHDVLTAAQPSLTIEATQGSAFGGVVARFTDNDLVSPASDFSASINWGDGTTTSGIVSGSNGSFTVSGTHNYGIAGKLPLHVTLSDDGAGTASAVAAASALVVSPATLDLIDPLYGAVADLLGPFFQGFFGITNERIGLLTTIPATEGQALTLPNILGDVPLPPDIPDMLLTSIPVAGFIDGNPADTATDFIALINWGDGTTTQGAVTLVASQDFDPAPGFVPPLHAAVFMVTGTHTYADESASEPLSVGIIRTSDNLSGTLHRSATIDFGHPAVVAGVTVAEADVLVPVPLGPLTANPNVVDGVVARFTNTNLTSTAGDFIATIDWGDGTTTTTGTIDDVSGVITVSGTHSYANSGKYALAVTLADDDGNANATATAQLFAGAAHAPQGAADSYFTPQDQVLRVTAPGILSNDGDPDGDAITAMLSFGPQHGSLNLRADGSFDYTPASGFIGTDCFSYHDSDGSLCGAPVQVLINVRDLAPTGAADSYGVTHDRMLHVAGPGVLGNDTDPDGDPITAVKASDPLHGSLTLNADGSFDYAPNLGYIGPDSFTYRDTDGALASAPATVTLSVQDQAPVAGNDSFSVPEDATYGVSVGTPPGGLLGNDVDANGDPLTAILVGGPSHGTLTFDGDGGFTYHPAADYFGPDSFTYKANDGLLDSNVATVSIMVDPVNDAPVAQGGSASGDEDTPISGQVVATDVDNSADQLSYYLVSGPSHGTLTFSGTGAFTYTPNANFNGSDSFRYKANDGNLDSNIATVAITVEPVDDAPVAQDGSASGNEDTPISGQVVATDVDNSADQLSYSLVSGPSHGTLTLSGTGAFTYMPNANYNGADSFRYKANDGSLDSNIAVVSLTVNPVNDPPVAGWNYAGCQKNSSISSDAAHGVLANTSDVDLDVLTVSAVQLFGASTSTAVSAGHPAVLQGTYGKLTMNADGSYGYVANTRPGALPPQIVPQDIFTYTVNDGHGGTTAANLTVTVYGPGSTYLQASATVLNGGNGQSALDGGDFSHTLIGGNGPDWLMAGRGNDALTGGKGPDTFAFGPQIGKDVITDFDPKTDSIQFNHALFANYAAAMVSESFDGHNTTFTANHDANQTVTLQNVAPLSLTPSNFSFS